MGQSQSAGAGIGSYIVYRSPYGESYHTRPTCATSPDVPPMLDLAESALNNVEMHRIEEIQDELDGPQNLCSNCAADIARDLSNN